MQGWVEVGGGCILRQFTHQKRSSISEITRQCNGWELNMRLKVATTTPPSHQKPNFYYHLCSYKTTITERLSLNACGQVLFIYGCFLQLENADLCDKTHQERQICIAVKVQNRMMQQRNLELSGYGLDDQFFWSTWYLERCQCCCIIGHVMFGTVLHRDWFDIQYFVCGVLMPVLLYVTFFTQWPLCMTEFLLNVTACSQGW